MLGIGFTFTLHYRNKRHKLRAEKIYLGDSIEKWKVFSPDRPESGIVLRNDAPLVLKKDRYAFRFRWHLVESKGDVPEEFVLWVAKEIEEFMRDFGSAPPVHPKNMQ